MDNKVPERYFYHSFPRKGTTDLTKGLKILGYMGEIGLLLTPEQIEWKEKLSNGTYSKPWIVKQKRACFTELSLSELPAHAEEFGNFSLEFDLSTLRQLGAMPVVYLPAEIDQVQGAEVLGATMVARLGEIQQLLDRLMNMQKTIQDNPTEKTLNVSWSNQSLVTIQVQEINKLLASFQLGGQPLEQLSAAFRWFANFFYPTENLKYNTLLDYYRQREWRVGSNVIINGKPLSRVLTPDEKSRLIEIDSGFFQKEIEFRREKYPRINLCDVISEFNGTPFFSLVRRLIVPREAVASVKDFLTKSNSQIEVLILEDLT